MNNPDAHTQPEQATEQSTKEGSASEGRPVALITGASSGIGRAVAVALADTHHIVVGGRDVQRVNELVEQLPAASPFVVDLLDSDAVRRAAAEVVERLGRVDVLVHSAEMMFKAPSESFTRVQWRHGFEVNVFAPVELTNALLPTLRASHADVVFLNSGSGLYTYPGGTLYCGTKFALKAFADALREEERANDVRVISIHPGRVATPMQVHARALDNLPYEPEKYATVEDIAATIKVALETSRAATVETVVVRPSRA
ncbi:SDR family oxidoreductase [Micrococcoides hystricis]|uniref:SDR family oxidoreductase n=1 Tax=Micrococcoides hystricis TaxID=1572761 RepID=A0ABV6P9V0_9MICC